jgi:integrase
LNVSDYVERYLLTRDVTPNYASLLQSRVRRFLVWRGGDCLIASLDCDEVNRFLADLQTTKASRVTVDNYRRALLCIWRAAYMDRLTENPPLRIRSIRKPRRIVNAFTQDEIRRLKEVAGRLGGFFHNGVRRADFWVATIASAYSTGLRRGDLLSLRKEWIRADGTVTLTQSKTGYPVTVQICPEALGRIRRMPIEQAHALPWPHHVNAMPRQFRGIVKAAGVRPLQFRCLRASAGSYAEHQTPGNGPRMLGHRTAHVFHAHYEDVSITRPEAISPPPL